MSALTVLLGLGGAAVAGWIGFRLVARTPIVAPLEAGEKAAPPTQGPVAYVLAQTSDARALEGRVEFVARPMLAEHLERRGAEPATLPPVLQHFLAGGGADAWASAQRRAAFRGPGFVFPLYDLLAGATESGEARRVRYLDLVTKELVRTVESP